MRAWWGRGEDGDEGSGGRTGVRAGVKAGRGRSREVENVGCLDGVDEVWCVCVGFRTGVWTRGGFGDGQHGGWGFQSTDFKDRHAVGMEDGAGGV